jgi:hypothetical protein
MRFVLALAVLSAGCYSHTRFLADPPNEGTRPCVDSCEHGGGDEEACLAACPNIVVTQGERCAATGPDLVCVDRAHLNGAETAIAITAGVLAVGLAVLIVVALPTALRSQ